MPKAPSLPLLDDARLSALLLQLHRGVQTVAFEIFQAWALELVKPLLPFATGIWGSGAGVEQGVAFINSVYLHHLPPRLMEDYQPIRPLDPIAHACEAEPGRVVHICLEDARWRTRHYQPLQRYARQYGLVHNLCLAVVEARSASHQFITLSRPEAGEPFTAADMARMACLAPHLLAAFALRRRLHLSERALRPAHAAAHGGAIFDGEGLVHEATVDWQPLCVREWPQANEGADAALPSRLPPPLCEWLRVLGARSGPAQTSARESLIGNTVVVEAVAVHDLWVLTLRERAPVDDLSDREHEIAQHYAAGHSHKEIAQRLGIAPATVRAHLRAIFQKLRVKDKVALIRRLS